MHPLFYGLIAAFCWGVMGLVAKSSGLGSAWTAIMLGSGTFAMTLVRVNTAVPSTKALAIGFTAGLINGVGILAFGNLTSMKGIDTAIYIAISYATIPIFVVIIAWLFLKGELDAMKAIGVFAISFGVFVLSK